MLNINYDLREQCEYVMYALIHRCFLFDLDETQINKYVWINSIKVGAEGDISLGFLSLAQIIHYSDLE